MDNKMLRTARRIMSFVLVFMMFSGMIPTSTFTQDADAANHIIQKNRVGSVYNYLGPRFPMRVDDNGFCAYCQDHNADTPDASIEYTRQGEISDFGKIYIGPLCKEVIDEVNFQ